MNAAPSCRHAFTFVIRGNIAFEMPFTACAGKRATRQPISAAIRVTVMNKVQFLLSSEPRESLKPRSLYVIFPLKKTCA